MEEKNKCDCEALRKQAEEYLAGWKRARADYDNLQKETAKERIEIFKYANKEIILSLLPVLDNFEKAKEHQPAADSEAGKWVEGIDGIYRQMRDALYQAGLEKVEITGKFDPAFMEAVGQRSEDGREEDEVLETIVCAYKLRGVLIRAAKVIINKK
ncbi:MAG: nucleotide exchange factor GrpE [Patescibacteria group bacterium]|nr:nucleotide exchange factor GrpE [Patescibacteria group bacterium]